MEYELRQVAAPASLDEFARQHGLRLVVTERPLDRWARERGLKRFHAAFERAEVQKGRMLSSESGNGNTPEEAIADYAELLRGTRLVVNAYGSDRRVINCPNEWL